MDKKCWASKTEAPVLQKFVYAWFDFKIPCKHGKVFILQDFFPRMSFLLTVKACSNLLLKKEIWNINNEITELEN